MYAVIYTRVKIVFLMKIHCIGDDESIRKHRIHFRICKQHVDLKMRNERMRMLNEVTSQANYKRNESWFSFNISPIFHAEVVLDYERWLGKEECLLQWIMSQSRMDQAINKLTRIDQRFQITYRPFQFIKCFVPLWKLLPKETILFR